MLVLYIAHLKHTRIFGFVEGDDGLFASNVSISAQDYEALGFTIKIEEVIDPCTASFCGMVFAETGDIIKSPYKFIQNFGWTSSFLSANVTVMDSLLKAKSLSAICECPQCPIVGALSRLGLSLSGFVSPRFVYDGFHLPVDPSSMTVPKFCPSTDTRLLFEQLYHVSVEVQLACEKCIQDNDMDGLALLLPAPTDVFDYFTKYVEMC
jgi:hypothetical protein